MKLPTREEIKIWIKTHTEGREWLAGECGVAKTTIDQWLSKKAIPIAQHHKIADLMNPKKEDPEEEISLIRVPFTDDALENAHKAASIVSSEFQEFCALAIQHRSEEIIRKSQEGLRLVSDSEYVLPFWGAVAAGEQVQNQTTGEMIPVDKEYPEGYFVVEVNGQSMEPDLMDGDKIVCEPRQYSPGKNKICVVSDGYGSSVKRYDREKNAYVSINPDFPDLVPAGEVKLQGYYVETLSAE